MTAEKMLDLWLTARIDYNSYLVNLCKYHDAWRGETTHEMTDAAAEDRDVYVRIRTETRNGQYVEERLRQLLKEYANNSEAQSKVRITLAQWRHLKVRAKELERS